MKIKSIDQFTIYDCENYLAQNPNGDNADAVKTRLHYLQLQEIERNRQKKEKLYHVNWIDIREFLGTTKYKNIQLFINALKCICLLATIFYAFVSLSGLYYINTKHHKTYYTEYHEGYSLTPKNTAKEHLDRSNLDTLEKLLLEFSVIEDNNNFDIVNSIVQESLFEHLDIFEREDSLESAHRKYFAEYKRIEESPYDIGNNFNDVIVTFVALIVIVYLLRTVASPILSKIHIIERPNSKSKKQVLRVQGNNGKMGLCYCGIFRVKRLLPFEFDKIYPCGNNAFICELLDQKGVYNTDKRQMVIPMRHQDIEVCQNNDNTVLVITNGQSEKFTTNGYRVIN